MKKNSEWKGTRDEKAVLEREIREGFLEEVAAEQRLE